jgi:yecA family protein
MDLATLEGFLTALVIGPNIVRPSQWIPWIWDRIDGQVAPPFEDLDEANAMLGLVMRLHNGLINRFRIDPEAFRPVYLDGARWGASEWCEGFLTGTRLDSKAWSLLKIHGFWLERRQFVGDPCGRSWRRFAPSSTMPRCRRRARWQRFSQSWRSR